LAVPGRFAVGTPKPLGVQTTRVSNRSLDEFAGGPAGSDGADGTDDADDSAAVDADRSVPTMRWSVDGTACDACGSVVSRRWRDGEAPRASGSRPAADATFVCADCKGW
jgi:hypothetical protein